MAVGKVEHKANELHRMATKVDEVKAMEAKLKEDLASLKEVRKIYTTYAALVRSSAWTAASFFLNEHEDVLKATLVDTAPVDEDAAILEEDKKLMEMI